jgi:hypothetical protein
VHEPPRNLLTRDVRESAVARIDEDGGFLQVYWGEFALGGKIQTKGPRCRPWKHTWDYVTYKTGVGRLNHDKLCTTCNRRIPLN